MGCTVKVSLLLLLQLISTAAAQNTYPTFPLPSHCPKSCGHLSIEYPFGIGDGCFRPGFNLTCNHTTHPPKLFLGNSLMEVNRSINAKDGHVLIKTDIISMSVDVDSYHAPLMDLRDGPYSLYMLDQEDVYYFSSYSWIVRSLQVVGCSAVAYLVDLNANKIISDCVTICPGNDTSQDNEGLNHCSMDIPLGNDQWYGIQLTRLNQDELHLINASSIRVFIPNIYYYPMTKDLEGLDGSMKMEASLGWYINDQPSCIEAKMHQESYACLSSNSACYDASPQGDNSSERVLGYFCQCSSNIQGNPYVPNGCKDTTTSVIFPTANCTRRCGDINDIPFPFGLEEGCYRDEWFALKCNHTANPPILLLNLSYVWTPISNILLEEGQLELKNHDDFILMTPQFAVNPFTFLNASITFNWVINYQSCIEAKKNMTTYACGSGHSHCMYVNITKNGGNHLGYRCKCNNGYEGNPYIPDGCKDIDECKHPEKYACKAICINSIDSYSCTCPHGTYGDDPIHGLCLSDKKQTTLVIGAIVGVCICFSILILTMSLVFISRRWKKRKQKEIRARYFCQNHGLLLQQLISSDVHIAEKTKIFSLEELKKATNNFDETRVIGHGGHGTVYKGILLDQRIVAIKKSKIIKQREIDQFINEVAILSQINHRNVVKLFGCCLETEVLLLVYEFVSNGTLLNHLHVPNSNNLLSWEDRLRIAAEAAGALAYLHSAASISIFHRDIKSSNILLDDYYTAKVSDFGASRSIPLDQTHIITGIQGTFGYLDPEYYQTSQLTKKSDVYSFGVILVELLTGKKPVFCNEFGEETNLSIYFLRAMRDKCLLELIEDHIVKEVTEEELKEVTQLAEMCLKLKGNERPTMKEVEFILQNLRKIKSQKSKNNWNVEGDRESESLLRNPRDIVYEHSNCNGLVNRANQHASRNYSMENELMSSLNHPR